jgi:two-component system, NtrC family, sensor kinase
MTDVERDLWRLIEVTQAISASLDLDQVLGLIIDAALSVLTADAAVIVLLDDQRRPHLRSERARRPSRAATTKYSHTYIDQVLATGEPAFVLDSDLQRAVRPESVQSLGLRTIVCAPLRSRGEIRGVLYAHSTHPLHAFTERKKQLFLTLCDHASIAINNAQLYQMRELALASSEGVLMVEHDQIQLCNHAARGLLRRAEEQIVGRSVLELFDPADRPLVARLLVEVNHKPCELRLLRAGGPPLLVEMAITPSRDARRVVLLRDISKQRDLQQRIIQTDRLAAIGTLAAGVAHEINNPLTYMSCNAQMLLDQLSGAAAGISADQLAEARALLEEIVEGGNQVAGIVKDLATLAREPAGDRGPTDLAAILKSSLKIASSHIGSVARVSCEWGTLPAVAASAPRLGQVFLNLLVNAAQAIPKHSGGEHEIRIRAAQRDQVVRVEIEDTGVGIPEQVRDRIFDPFFTTKPFGEGTGLGLWICHGIIRSIGGTIEVRPGAASRGTCFVMDLPIAEPIAEPVAGLIATPATAPVAAAASATAR